MEEEGATLNEILSRCIFLELSLTTFRLTSFSNTQHSKHGVEEAQAYLFRCNLIPFHRMAHKSVVVGGYEQEEHADDLDS